MIDALEAGRWVVAEPLLLPLILLRRRSGRSRCTRRRLLDAAAAVVAASQPVLSISCPPSLLAGELADCCSAADECGTSLRGWRLKNTKKSKKAQITILKKSL